MTYRRRGPPALVCTILVIATLLGAGCGASTAYPEVRLRDLEPMQASQGVGDDEPPSLRVAIASVISPRGTILSYNALLDYLGAHLGRRVKLVQRQTYAETNDLIARAGVDMAFICTGAYVEGQRERRMELLVAPQVNGKMVYYSYIIVPDDSPARTLDDLRGKVFAFTDPLSNSGRLAVVYALAQRGERAETFFNHYIYTYSHDNSIRAVADRVVDGAAVDSLVYDFFLERAPEVGAKVRVIEQSSPFAIPPVVVPSGLDPSLKAQLRYLLLNMHEDAQGRAALAELRVDRFVMLDDSAYESVREMIEFVRWR